MMHAQNLSGDAVPWSLADVFRNFPANAFVALWPVVRLELLLSPVFRIAESKLRCTHWLVAFCAEEVALGGEPSAECSRPGARLHALSHAP